MIKEKLIHWRNIHSPLLYDLAKHIDGPSKYWDVILDKDYSPLERAIGVLQAKGLKSDDYRVVIFEKIDSYKIWNEQLELEEWDLTLRADGFGILINIDGTERKNLILGGMLRFFNS